MSNIHRTRLATLMLRRQLPDADIAADMLLAAEPTEAVKMATPPNPVRCRSLIRGSAVKAATLALSTNDPETLGKLARHAALVVKRSAASNEYLPDEGRRLLESFAIKRSDNALLNAVINHASLEYIIEAMATPDRRAHLGWIFSNSRRLSQLFEREVPPTHEEIYALLMADPDSTAAAVGRVIGQYWPGPWDPIQYAEALRAISKDVEVKFLANFVSHAALADTTVVMAYHQMRESAPEHFPEQRSMTHRATMHAVAVEPGALQALLELGLSFAGPVFSAEPTVRTLEIVEQLYGLDGVKATLAQGIGKAGEDVLRWALDRLVDRGPDGTYRTELFNGFAEHLIPLCEPSDHERIRTLLSASPTYATVRYITGQLGESELDLVEELAHTQLLDVLKVAKTLRDTPRGVALIKRVIANGNLAQLIGMPGHVYTGLTVGEIKQIVERAVADGQLGANSDMYADVQIHKLATPEFAAEYDRPDLTSDEVLTWLRMAQSSDLTLRFVSGQLQRVPTSADIVAIFASSGRAYGSISAADFLVRNFAEIRTMLTDDLLDIAVDAAGSEFFARACARSNDAFIEYLAERLNRGTGSSDEWTTAFELLTTTSVAVGKAIAGATKLNRIRGNR